MSHSQRQWSWCIGSQLQLHVHVCDVMYHSMVAQYITCTYLSCSLIAEVIKMMRLSLNGALLHQMLNLL